MLDSVAIYETPVTSRPAFQEQSDRAATQFVTNSSMGVMYTALLGKPQFQLFRVSDQSSSIEDLQAVPAAESYLESEAPSEVVDPLALAQESRLMLLADKYEGNITREGAARLQLLTQRLRKLSPRVSQADFERLSTLVDAVEANAGALEELRHKYAGL